MKHIFVFLIRKFLEKNYGGTGTYTLKNDKYTEILQYTSIEVKIKGDTLIQYGIYNVEAKGINRKIVKKYIKLK